LIPQTERCAAGTMAGGASHFAWKFHVVEFHTAVTLSVNKFLFGLSTASANPVMPPANSNTTVTIDWSASKRAPNGTTTIELIGNFGIAHERDTGHDHSGAV
jgi:hypothetical protein